MGVLAGALVQTLLPGAWVPFLVAIAVVVSLLACRLLRVGAGQRLGMALAGFFVFIPGAEEWSLVGWRLLATLVGIAVALGVSLLLWPSSSRARLGTGTAEILGALRASIATSLVRWDPPDPDPDTDRAPAPVPPAPASLATRVTALRALVGEIRHEPGGDGPPAEALEAMLDGVALAVRAADRLARSATPGSARLARHLRPAVAEREAEIVRLADAIGAALADHRALDGLTPAATGASGAEAATAAAIEAMRARNVTPGADAAELLALFAIADSLLVIVDGLRRAALAIVPQGPAGVRESD